MSREPTPLPFSSVGQLRLALSEMESRYAQGGATTVGQMLRPLGAERDGLVTVIGMASLLVSVFLFAALGVAAAVDGAGVTRHLLAWTAG
jgi:hypothetical protein